MKPGTVQWNLAGVGGWQCRCPRARRLSGPRRRPRWCFGRGSRWFPSRLSAVAGGATRPFLLCGTRRRRPRQCGTSPDILRRVFAMRGKPCRACAHRELCGIHSPAEGHPDGIEVARRIGDEQVVAALPAEDQVGTGLGGAAAFRAACRASESSAGRPARRPRPGRRDRVGCRRTSRHRLPQGSLPRRLWSNRRMWRRRLSTT